MALLAAEDADVDVGNEQLDTGAGFALHRLVDVYQKP